jgi:hypothetical protein
MRTYIDRDGDPWFEIEPDRFICAESRDGAIHQAQDVGMGTSLENLRIVFGPLTEGKR